MQSVNVHVFNSFPEQDLPQYAKPGDSGVDVRSTKNMTISPNTTAIIPTGLYVNIPDGFEIQVRPRSGTSYKTKLRVSNAPGTIDSGYRGEIGVIVDNIGDNPIEISVGERVAQLVLVPVYKIVWNQVNTEADLGTSERGSGGYGHSGNK